MVAKAGSRYQPFPGFADALEQFAFQVCVLQIFIYIKMKRKTKRKQTRTFTDKKTVYVETVSFADYSGGGIARRCLLLDAV